MLHVGTRPGTYRCQCGNSVHVTNLTQLKRCRFVNGRHDQCPAPADDECMGLCRRHATTLAQNIFLTMDGPERERIVEWQVKAEAHRQFEDAVQAAVVRHDAFVTRQDALRVPDVPVVYYVELASGIVKIGTTARLRERLVGLRLRPADVLAAEPGSYPLEKQRHRQFAALRIDRREDFRAEPALLGHIARVRAQHGDPLAPGACHETEGV